ncbi:MAG: hypothetical protein ACHQ53_03850 [Polyangiales bacterium]
MRPIALFGLSLLLAGTTACRESRLVMTPNSTPTAVARVIGPDGTSAKSAQFDYNGSDVAVTLDGSQSSDKDGAVVIYRWLSGTPLPLDGGVGALTYTETLPDGGTKVDHGGGRLVPQGQGPDWPDDKAKPTVMLGVGVWTFDLWVIDDKGGISDPSTVTVTIGKPDPLSDPKVKMCADNVLPVVSASCRTCICNIDDTCRMNVQMDKCDATCWGLIQCIGTMCPNFATMAMAMPPDYSCLTTNCNAFLGGATGATPAGMCVTQCLSDCAPGGTPDAGTGH